MADTFDVDAMLALLEEKERTRLKSDEFKAECGGHFDTADASKTGDLSEAEMAEAVKLALPEERRRIMDITPENVKELMMNFDANKNGKIEKDEFTNFVTWCIAKECADYFAAAGNSSKAASAAFKKNGKACIQELKSLAKPPAGVDKVISCIGILIGKMDKVDNEWKAIQKMMADANFVNDVAGCTEPKGVDKVKAALAEEGMDKETITKKSRAGGMMLDWILAVTG